MNFKTLVVSLIVWLLASAAQSRELKPIKLGLSDREMCFYEQLPIEIKKVPSLSEEDKAAFLNAKLQEKMELLDNIFDSRSELLLEKASAKAKVSTDKKYDFSEKNVLKFMRAFEKYAYNGYEIKGCKKSRNDGETIRVLHADWMHSTLLYNELLIGFDNDITAHYGAKSDRLLTIRVLAFYGSYKASRHGECELSLACNK